MATRPEGPGQEQGHSSSQDSGGEEQSTPSPSASVPPYASPSHDGPGVFRNGVCPTHSQNGSEYSEPHGPATPPRNIVGIMAVVAAVLGILLACFPGLTILDWPLLLIAFSMGIVAVCLPHQNTWQGIVAIALSVVGAGMSIAVLLTAAAATMNNGETASTSDSTSQASAPESDIASEAADDEDSDARNGRFGQTAAWDDGVALTVGEPEAFTPSDAAGTPSGSYQYRRFSVTVHNGTKNPIDAGAIDPTVRSGGKYGELVLDPDNGAVGGGSGKIQPGKDLTYIEAYGVADPSDISMDLRIPVDDGSFTEHHATFTS